MCMCVCWGWVLQHDMERSVCDLKQWDFLELIGSLRSMSLPCSSSLPRRVLWHWASSLWRRNLSAVRRSLCFAEVERPRVKAFPQSPWGRSAGFFHIFYLRKDYHLSLICPKNSHTFSSDSLAFIVGLRGLHISNYTNEAFIMSRKCMFYNCKKRLSKNVYCYTLGKHDDIGNLNYVQRVESIKNENHAAYICLQLHDVPCEDSGFWRSFYRLPIWLKYVPCSAESSDVIGHGWSYKFQPKPNHISAHLLSLQCGAAINYCEHTCTT